MAVQNILNKSNIKNYLVIGGDGYIGSALTRHFTYKNIPFISTIKKHRSKNFGELFLDLNNFPNNYELPSEISKVFFCAGITSIDTCQKNPKKSNKINVDNTLKLIGQFIKNKIHVIYLSTNMVFDGSQARTKISDSINPKTNYGKQKAKVEKELLSLDSDYFTIVRFSKIIDSNLQLIKSWIISLIDKKQIHPFSDLVMSPITLEFCVNILTQIAEKNFTGILQVSGDVDIRYSDFANLIVKKLGVDKQLVKSVKAADLIDHYNLLPKNTTMNTDDLFQKFKIRSLNNEEIVESLLNNFKRDYPLLK